MKLMASGVIISGSSPFVVSVVSSRATNLIDDPSGRFYLCAKKKKGKRNSNEFVPTFHLFGRPRSEPQSGLQIAHLTTPLTQPPWARSSLHLPPRVAIPARPHLRLRL